MENGVEMGKSFSTWGFPIPIPLNLLGSKVKSGGEIFKQVGNGVRLPTPLHPITIHTCGLRAGFKVPSDS